jgi:hypothetical protein
MKPMSLNFGISALFLALAVSSASAQISLIGTWRFDVGKSKFNPGPAWKSGTITYEAVSGGMRNTFQGVDGNGCAARLPLLKTANITPSPA